MFRITEDPSTVQCLAKNYNNDSINYLSNIVSMEMWRNHIQRVKIVINDSIIEKVTHFKYLEYRISEYGIDLEDKLQTYNKINGAVRSHFGKKK